LGLRHGGAGTWDGVTIAWMGFYLTATLPLLLSLMRDPDLRVAAGFIRSRVGLLTILLLTLVFQVLAMAGSFLYAATAVTGISGILFCLWFRCRDAAALIRAVSNGVLVCMAIVFSLAVLEAMLRVPAVANRVRPPAHTKEVQWRYRDYDKHVLTRHKGTRFRSFHLDKDTDDSAFRIVVLGDSYTWGDKVRETPKIWPYQMEEALSLQRIPSRVFNLAQLGNTTVNEFEYLEVFGWDLDPDLVIIQYLINDPLPSLPGFRRRGDAWMQEETLPLAVSSDVHRLLNGHSYIYSLLNHRWAGMLRRVMGLRDLTYFDLHADGFPPWEDCKKAIAGIADACRKREIPVLFVMFPLLKSGIDLGEDYPFLSIHDKVRQVVAGLGIPYMDLLPVYARKNPNSNFWRVLPNDGHPGEYAHEVAGKAVAGRLLDLGLLTPE